MARGAAKKIKQYLRRTTRFYQDIKNECVHSKLGGLLLHQIVTNILIIQSLYTG